MSSQRSVNDWRDYLKHYNPYHDDLGRFASSNGVSVGALKKSISAYTNRLKGNRYKDTADKYKSKYEKRKIKSDKAFKKYSKQKRKITKLERKGKDATELKEKESKNLLKYEKRKVKSDKYFKKYVKNKKRSEKYVKRAIKIERNLSAKEIKAGKEYVAYYFTTFN